jgi:hypothetical protein
MQSGGARKKDKLIEKELEKELSDLLNQTAGSSDSEKKLERMSAISAYLLLRTGKKIERFSLALLIMTIVFAVSIVSFVLILAYIYGFISF